ncbi:MAG: HEAT repeat domain-containing protein, partial [Planctomycetota bacterium]
MSSRSNDNVICRFGFVLAALALCIACHSTDSSTEAKPEPSLPSAASDPYAAISSYAFGNSREPLSLIEKEIRGASQARLAEIERRFIDLLASDNCTEAGKQFVCRMLRRMGTDASVPALASLLSDETLSDAARFALQGRSSPLADQAFRDALDELGGFLQIGVIHSMAQREDRKVIPALGGLLGSDEPFLVRACLSALGALGGPEAAVFLNRVEVTADLENDLDHARLQCAHSFLEHGDKKAAAELFRSLTLENKTIPVRIAGWQGLCRAEEEKAVPMLVSLLASDDEGLRAAALGFLISFQQNTEVDAALVESLESAGAKARASLIRCITTRRTPGALPILLRCTGDEEKQVRQRAVQGLAALAGAEDLPELVDLMDVMGNEEDLEALKEAILVVISRLPEGDERTRYLQERYGQSVNASRVALLDLLGRMPDENTLSLLNAALLGADLRLKSTAVRALAAWPDATPLNTLLDLARKATDPALRAGAHKGLVNMLDYPSSRTPEETC